VVILEVRNGKVVKKQELKNARIKSPSEEENEERSKHMLWPFPTLESGTIQTYSGSIREKFFFITVKPEALRRTPAWQPTTKEPPLSPLKAILLAERKSRQLEPASGKYSWVLDDASLKAANDNRYYYRVTFYSHPPDAVSLKYPPYLRLLVLMDGTVPEPEVWEAADLLPAIRAGAFFVDDRKWHPHTPPWTWADRGGVWSELSWRVRLYLLGQIAAAPKLFYELEKIDVYPNGVWVEYSVSNWSNKRKFFSPTFLNVPVINAGLWDSRRGRWRVPTASSDAVYGKPQEFVAIDAGQSLRYRVLMSTQVDKPLEPFIRDENRAPSRPAALEYFVAAWPTAYTQLAEDANNEVTMFAFGYGRVPVKWFDKEYPQSWRATKLEPTLNPKREPYR
jgi:hypothetical protein